MVHLQQNQPVLKDRLLDRLQHVATDVEALLDQLLPPPSSRLHEAMRYSVLGGGKRLRSYVLYEAAGLFNVPKKNVMTVAAAVEMIQGYSLVHDDLPAMDDADLRRGKPSCHMTFGEATAILVGDALLPLAFQTLCSLDCSPDMKLKLINGLAITIGSQGLVDGQMRDLGQENPLDDYNDILEMERLKTAVLFGYVAEVGAILGGAIETEQKALKNYGLLLGEVFQMRDDLLDGIGSSQSLGKPSGQDAQKRTIFTLLGSEQLKQKTEQIGNSAVQELHCFGDKARYLIELVEYTLQRTR